MEKKRSKQEIREQLKRLTELKQKLAEKEIELDETLYKLRAHVYRDTSEIVIKKSSIEEIQTQKANFVHSRTYATTEVFANKPNRVPISSTHTQRTPYVHL